MLRYPRWIHSRVLWTSERDRTGGSKCGGVGERWGEEEKEEEMKE